MVGCLPGLLYGWVLRMDFPGAEATPLHARYPLRTRRARGGAAACEGHRPIPC